jgi:hypothetical protein
MSNIGNTAGTTGTVANGIVFAGGNNVTLSQSINNQSATITISGANQTVQTQNLHNVSLAGNTAGALAQVSSGTLTLAGGNNITLSQNGNAVTISGAAGGAGFSAGISDIGNTLGTSGTTDNQLVLAGGNNITLSQATGAGGNTITISGAAGGGGGETLSRWQNMDRGTSALLAIPYNSLFIQRLNQENDLFAGNLTASTVLLNMSGSVSTGASSTQTLAARTLSITMGIYEPVASANTVLTLINSASTTFGTTTTGSVFPYYHGNRWLSIHSSQWSIAPVFSQGKDYVFGMLVRSSGTSTGLSFIGQNYMNSNQRSGYFGASVTSGSTSMPHGNYWNALYSVTTAGLPTGISGNQVNRNNATAVFIPHVILNNQYTY